MQRMGSLAVQLVSPRYGSQSLPALQATRSVPSWELCWVFAQVIPLPPVAKTPEVGRRSRTITVTKVTDEYFFMFVSFQKSIQ